MKPRILIVEDNEDILAGNTQDLLRMSTEQKDSSGVDSFVIHDARTVEEATNLLNEAQKFRSPYDLVLLDLSLPLSKTTPRESPDSGMKILKLVGDTGAARGVIVVSVFSMHEYVVKAFRDGAVDFIAKPFTRETLQTQVLKSFEKVSARAFEELVERRPEELGPYAENMLTYRLGVCFSRFIQSIVNETESLQDGFKERWGLDVDRDSADTQVQHLIAIEKAVGSAKLEWNDMLSSLNNADDAPGVCVLEEVVSEIRDLVLPWLSLKKIKLTMIPGHAAKVRTFQDDVQTVVKEIVFGALSELINHDNPSGVVELSVRTNGDRAEVCFKDNFDRIESKTADAISNGITVLPEPRFSRAWGLSVAQHIALRGGGRIKVEANEERNLITYSIPLADHA